MVKAIDDIVSTCRFRKVEDTILKINSRFRHIEGATNKNNYFTDVFYILDMYVCYAFPIDERTKVFSGKRIRTLLDLVILKLSELELSENNNAKIDVWDIVLEELMSSFLKE